MRDLLANVTGVNYPEEYKDAVEEIGIKRTREIIKEETEKFRKLFKLED